VTPIAKRNRQTERKFVTNTIADDKREAAITVNREEDKAFESTSTMEEITKQLKFILSKLEGLETKVETAIETVNQLQTTVNRLENTVEKVQEDAKLATVTIWKAEVEKFGYILRFFACCRRFQRVFWPRPRCQENEKNRSKY